MNYGVQVYTSCWYLYKSFNIDVLHCMDNKAIDYISLSLLYFVCHNCSMLSLAYSYDGLWRPILLYARKSKIPDHCFHHCVTTRHVFHEEDLNGANCLPWKENWRKSWNVNRYRKRNFNCKNILTTKFKGTSISCLTIIVSYIILTLLSFLFFPQRNGRKLYHP